MSADAYEDCPCCLGKKTVRIDGLRDYELKPDGCITTSINGRCEECGLVFSTNKHKETRSRP